MDPLLMSILGGVFDGVDLAWVLSNNFLREFDFEREEEGKGGVLVEATELQISLNWRYWGEEVNLGKISLDMRVNTSS